MAATLREALNRLHTWTGLVVGGLLFAIVWTGTLCVFDREIDRWMNPSTRLAYAGDVAESTIAGSSMPSSARNPGS